MDEKEYNIAWGLGDPCRHTIAYDRKGKQLLVVDEGAQEIDVIKEIAKRYVEADDGLKYAKKQLEQKKKELAEAENEVKREIASKSLLEEALVLEEKGELKRIKREEFLKLLYSSD